MMAPDVLDVSLDGNSLRVTLSRAEDCDLFIDVMRRISAPGCDFEILDDRVVLCKMPPRHGSER